MLSHNRCALKEWEGSCARLRSGELILLVRKGGILELREGFRVEHREFFLYPTRFHERGEAPPGRVELDLYARVEDDLRVSDLEQLRRLQGHHALAWEDAEHRFHYGKEKGVHVLAIRAYPLTRPAVVEDARAYDGCRSWVELARELPVEVSAPVLGADDFQSRLETVRRILMPDSPRHPSS